MNEASLRRVQEVFEKFLLKTESLPERSFHGRTSGRLNISIFDAVFAACCAAAWRGDQNDVAAIDSSKLEELKSDNEFVNATLKSTSDRTNVEKRLSRAASILG